MNDSGPQSLRIYLLGRFRVLVDGLPVDENQWTRRKPRTLLKVLALQPHHQLHREQLLDLLWPDLDSDAANNNLHKIIHLTRHALEPQLKSAAESSFILVRGAQVMLRAPNDLWIDSEAFVHLAHEASRNNDFESGEQALSLYDGDLLTEDLYEEWTTVPRERLRSIYLELLTKLAGLNEARGNYSDCINLLRKVIDSEATNELAHRQLMSVYARIGNRSQALRQYEWCCDVMRTELDAQPGLATQHLHSRILADQVRVAPDSSAAREASDQITSLAILPLVNSSADPNAEYLSDGITESIINNLSQLRRLRVMSRGAVLRYKGLEVNPQDVGLDLGVRAVLLGKVLQLADQLIIRAELVDTRDGAQLWGEQYDRRFGDVLAVQEEIASRISEALQLKLSGEEHGLLTRRQTHDTEAYQAYLKGLYFWNKRTEGGLMRAIEHFIRASEKDPEYALAHAMLASSYTLLSWYSVRSPRESFPKAKAAASKALQLDGELPEAFIASAWIKFSFDWDYPGAEKDLKTGIKLNPEMATAHQWYSHHLSAMERHVEALEQIESARRLDPLSLVINRDVGWISYFARDYDRATEAYKRTMELAPSFYIAHYFFGETYEQMGRKTDAIGEFLETRSHTKEGTRVWTLMAQARANALLGKVREARAVIDELTKLSKEHYVSPYLIAIVHTSLDDNQETLNWLEAAYEERDCYLVHLRVDPALDRLRSEPRFNDLLIRVGLSHA